MSLSETQNFEYKWFICIECGFRLAKSVETKSKCPDCGGQMHIREIVKLDDPDYTDASNPPIFGSEFRRWCTFMDLGGREKFNRACDRAWFTWFEKRRLMQYNRTHWPYSWKALLRYIREGRETAIQKSLLRLESEYPDH